MNRSDTHSGAAIAVGVDIGGTSTKLGLVAQDGEILYRASLLTPHQLRGEEIFQSIIAQLDRLIQWTAGQDLRPAGIGISICGYLEPNGKAPDYINLHALDHLPLVSLFQERYSLPVAMDNDMNCGALGEYYFGGGRSEPRLMVMTVGTGIGMAVMLDGKVLRLNAGTVGNPGHTIVAADGPVCTAGCIGCLESLASAGPISRRAEDFARSHRSTLLKEVLARNGCLNPKDVYHAAEAGDTCAQEIWQETGKWLGRGLATWVEIFGPEVVIVGGGVAQAGHWLLAPLEHEMRRVGELYFTSRVREINGSRLGQELAMLGAATFYLYPENAPPWAK